MTQTGHTQKRKGDEVCRFVTYSNLHKKRLIRGYDMDTLPQFRNSDDDFRTGKCAKCGREAKRLFVQKGRAGQFCSSCIWTTPKQQTNEQGHLSDSLAATHRLIRIRVPFCCGCGSGETRIGSGGLLCVECVELMRGLDRRGRERFVERIADNVKRHVWRCI